MNKRIVITGYGALGSTGMNADELWQGIIKGETGIRPIDLWDSTHWEYNLGAVIKEYQPRKMVRDKKLIKMISRHDVFGLNAATQAVEHSKVLEYRDNLANPDRFNDRTGVYVASPGIKFNQQYDLFPLFTRAEGDLQKFAEGLFEEVHPMWLLRILSNNVLAYVGIENQFKGPNHNITNHAVSGTQAVSEAMHAINAGNMDRAIVVAYEAGIEPQAQKYYAGIGALSKQDLRPFHAQRDGTILAEAGAALMIETLESAQQRGATIYGEILAEAMAGEAQGIFPLREDGDGLANAVEQLLERAEITPEQVGMITAHGNGNPISDLSEVRAYQRVFNDALPPVTSFKWSLGHSVTAAGILETIMTLKALQAQQVPGIANLTELDSHMQNAPISQQAQATTSPVGLTVTRGFCGMNACLLVKALS